MKTHFKPIKAAAEDLFVQALRSRRQCRIVIVYGKFLPQIFLLIYLLTYLLTV